MFTSSSPMSVYDMNGASRVSFSEELEADEDPNVVNGMSYEPPPQLMKIRARNRREEWFKIACIGAGLVCVCGILAIPLFIIAMSPPAVAGIAPVVDGNSIPIPEFLLTPPPPPLPMVAIPTLPVVPAPLAGTLRPPRARFPQP